MHILYNLGVRLYGFVIRIASIFNPKAKAWIDGRKDYWSKLPLTKKRQVIWFHCASLGEFDQGLPLMNLIKKQQPEAFLLVSFYSPSGYLHHHKRNHLADHVCYLPLDTPSNAKKFAAYFKPSLTVFVKYEFWGNHIKEAKKKGSQVYVISGLFRENHRFFKWYGSYFRGILGHFDHLFVQDSNSQELLMKININNTTVAGDNRFDRVIENSKNATRNPIIEAFKGDEEILIVGSSWPADEAIITDWINKVTTKVLIAPHQIDEPHIEKIVEKLNRKFVRYTQWKDQSDCEVLILDTIGHLASAYQSGKIAYVGGGFSGSLHNILEPAVFGLPVIFGPKHSRFPEAQQFIDGGFGFSVSTTEEFETAYNKIDANYQEISLAEKDFVQKNAGASERILNYLIANSTL